MMSPAMYEKLYGKNILKDKGASDDYEVNPEKEVVIVTVNKA